jgi:hypothetical protein
MGLFDALKGKKGPSFRAEPVTNSARDSARAAWRAANNQPDEHARLDAAVGLMEVELFEDALLAFQSLATAFPKSRGEYARWMAQIHYTSLSFRRDSEKDKLRCYTTAYALYLQAAEAGDRTQEPTVYELLELLNSRAEISVAKKRENLESFIRLFPDGVHKHQAQSLLDAMTE